MRERKTFEVPNAPYFFETMVSKGQIINPYKYWKRYLNGRRSPRHVAKVGFNGDVKVIK